jgi:hypothetical protein
VQSEAPNLPTRLPNDYEAVKRSIFSSLD